MCTVKDRDRDTEIQRQRHTGRDTDGGRGGSGNVTSASQYSLDITNALYSSILAGLYLRPKPPPNQTQVTEIK
eukprot:3617642-Rhodomonas_salina.1